MTLHCFQLGLGQQTDINPNKYWLSKRETYWFRELRRTSAVLVSGMARSRAHVMSSCVSFPHGFHIVGSVSASILWVLSGFWDSRKNAICFSTVQAKVMEFDNSKIFVEGLLCTRHSSTGWGCKEEDTEELLVVMEISHESLCGFWLDRVWTCAN